MQTRHPPMHALSIRQPWADLLAYGFKDVENRTWRPPPHLLRNRIALHAASKPDDRPFPLELLHNQPSYVTDVVHRATKPDRLGAIIGTAVLTACLETSDSPWFFGPYGYLFTHPHLLAQPLRLRGRLGFFQLPDGVLNQNRQP